MNRPEKTLTLSGSRRRPRKLEVMLLISAVAFYGLCVCATAFAAEEQRHVAALPPLTPLKPEKRNGDYLKEPQAPPVEKTLNAAIFEKSISDEMTEKFDSFNRTYEARQPYQLNRREDFLQYEKANKELAEWTLKKLLQFHVENTLKNNIESSIKRTAKESNSKGERAAANAVVALSKVHKAIQNSTFNLGKDTKTRFKYDFPSGILRFALTSPLVDASMDYRLKPVEPTVGMVASPEKLSLGMTRNFEFARLSTGVRYGLLTETVNYGLNKHVAGPVSAQVDQAHGIRDTSKDETLFRLNLGTQF